MYSRYLHDYIYIYISIYIFIEATCPYEQQAIAGEPGKFNCLRESRKAVIYVSNIYSKNANPAEFNPSNSDAWVNDLTKPIYNLFLAYLKVYINCYMQMFIYIIYIGSYIGISCR